METISLPSYGWLILVLAICVGLFPSLDRRRFPHRVVASGCTILVTIGYLVWRACFTLDLSSLAGVALSGGFFVLEAISNISAIMVMIVLVRLRLRSQEADDNSAWVRETMPSVAIFIATYNEDRTILDRTILGALKQDHPVAIYLLDDGRRPEIAALCRDRGVRYLTRADNFHAKAGNMNAGLASLAALGEAPDFIAILDADFVPFPQFISRSLTLFHDPKVGVVQTPQHFFNPDPLQHSLRAPIDLPDEQRFFFDTLLPAKDGWGAAFSCGTSSMVRTTALAAVGGFPTDSITEDMLLSMRMKRFGYETAYLNEQLSLGLAPEGLSEYCSQRIRWCIGAMQIVRGADGLRAGNGLTWVDRANLVDTVLYWIGSFPFRIACLLIPILYWFTGLTVMNASLEDLTVILGCKVVVEAFCVAWYSKGRLLPILTDCSQLLIAPEVIAAGIFTLFRPGEKPFKVTNKGGDRSKTVVHWWMLRRFLGVACITLLGVVANYTLPVAPAFFSNQKSVVTLWSLYNILICIVGINVSIERPRRSSERLSYRKPGMLDAAGQQIPIELVDISSGGVGFTCLLPLQIGDQIMISIEMIGVVAATISRVAKQRFGARILLNDEQHVIFTGYHFAGTNHALTQVAPRRSAMMMVRGIFR